MAAPHSVRTPQQYLESERVALEKSEFIDGRLVAMSGVLRSHARIATNLITSLSIALQGSDCDVFGSGMRVAAPARKNYFYPDLVIACDGQYEDDAMDVLVSPQVIIEILSKSTEAYDRGDKFSCYRQMASLEHYILVSQYAMKVEVFTRGSDDLWVFQEFVGAEAVLDLRLFDAQISLADIYRRVEFEPEKPK